MVRSNKAGLCHGIDVLKDNGARIDREIEFGADLGLYVWTAESTTDCWKFPSGRLHNSISHSLQGAEGIRRRSDSSVLSKRQGDLIAFFADESWDSQLTADLTAFNLYYKPQYLECLAMSAFDKELPNLDIARARLGEDDVIRNVINRFILPARWRDAGNEIYLSHMIHMVLYRFMSLSVEGLDTLQNRVGGLAEKKAKEVEEFMRANLSEKLSVSQLAELTGMSVFHFLRSFKIRFSVTPYQYLSKLRLERAKNLLLTTQRPISDIALDCGFSNQSHLTMRFKKAIDLTPGQYRGCQRLFQ